MILHMALIALLLPFTIKSVTVDEDYVAAIVGGFALALDLEAIVRLAS